MENEKMDTLENEQEIENEIKQNENDNDIALELEETKKKADEYFDHLKRNMAEFDNFKKRVAKEKETMYKTIVADFVSELLPVMDNFEKAMSANSKDESFKSGMEMIYNQIQDLLKKVGLEEIEDLGTQFDPNFHEAVMHIEDENYKEKEIIEVFRKGYKLGDKVIRHTMVKVAN